MSVERRGQAIRVIVNLANWQQEEPTGCGGGRQLSMDGTSRVTGDSHARFCERLGVKFPGATRRCEATCIPTATDKGKLSHFWRHAYQERVMRVIAIGDPEFDDLHSEPRFASLLERLRLPGAFS